MATSRARNSRCLFACENVFFSAGNGRIISAAPYGAALWSRYLDHFGTLEVLGLSGSVPEKTSVTVANFDKVSFTLLPVAGRWGRLKRMLAPTHSKIRAAVAAADAVVVRLPSEVGLLVLREAYRAKKPVALEIVGCAWDGHRTNSFAGGLYAPLAWWRMRKAVARSDFTLYVTEAFLQRRYPSKGLQTAASNVSIDVEPQALEQRIGRLRERSANTQWVFGTIGTIAQPQKGVSDALKALAEQPENLNFEYRVLGEGDPSRYLELAERYGILDRVKFSGRAVPAQEVLAWLNAIDVYLQPSLHEGLPRALIEAMSRGLPAIGSTAGGIPELLGAEFVHPVRDSKQLAKLITRMVSMSRQNLIAIAHENFTASQAYDRAIVAAKRRAFYGAFASHVERKLA